MTALARVCARIGTAIAKLSLTRLCCSCRQVLRCSQITCWMETCQSDVMAVYVYDRRRALTNDSSDVVDHQPNDCDDAYDDARNVKRSESVQSAMGIKRLLGGVVSCKK